MKHIIETRKSVCLIKQKEVTKTQSGIILSQTSNDYDLFEGSILAIGPQVSNFKVGDFVSWPPAMTTGKNYGDEKFVLVNSQCLTLRESIVEDSYETNNSQYVLREVPTGTDLMSYTELSGGIVVK